MLSRTLIRNLQFSAKTNYNPFSDKNLDLNSLLVQLGPVSYLYQQFGSIAGLSPDQLDEIVSNTTSSYAGLTEVCDLWLHKCRKENSPPTWRAVAEMLALIGEGRLSSDSLHVYSTGKILKFNCVTLLWFKIGYY